ncbi:MAG: TRZ/ATZ family hydrolase [Methylococcales bacterium]|jgi:5-methylthioadenosine/S-adenosylhomocysteine deaminase|nr:TRZ/ATZ family hydrolase [Methylococcales bacterium]MBT7410169.1 TRZ/ATZ family hydrolase [Methylococcales bacterium]
MISVDQIIHAKWLIPVIPENKVLENHAIAMMDGKIVDIQPSADITMQYQSSDVVRLDQHALIPGLINAHTHSPMNMMRGIADDLPLMDWLNNHIWPVEQKWVNENFTKAGSLLAFAEMIRGGTTCFNDMYFYPEITAHAAAQTGIRACIGMIFIDFPSNWAKDSDEYFEKGLQLHDQLSHHPLIQFSFAPHAPYTVSNEPFQKILTLSNQMELPIHIHIHETQDEIKQSQDQYKQRPIERLDAMNLLSPSLIAVHMTHTSQHEMETFARKGAHVVHCPESNQKLASGYCQVAELLDLGVNVALGTDGAASNNDLDMIGEMRSAAYMAKNVKNDPSVLPASQVLSMATINGAKALGLESEIGSLEIGKYADITAIDLSHIETQPVYNPISQIVYAATRNQVTDVWVAGKQLLSQRHLLTLNEKEIIEESQNWRDKILQG